jgi:hypothetical protein
VNLTSENPAPVVADTPIEFTYSVNWYPTNVAFEDRFRKYLDKSFFEHQVPCFFFFFFFLRLTSSQNFSDTLVFYFQFVYDGNLSGGPGIYDLDEDFEKRLCTFWLKG